MKKAFFTLCLLALALSCGKETFKIQVQVTDADQLPDQSIAYLLENGGAAVDSVPVVNGAFTFTGKTNPETLYTIVVRFPGKEKKDRTWMMPFIPDKGDCTATLSRRDWETKSQNLNKDFIEFQQAVWDLEGEFSDNSTGLEKAEVEALYQEMQEKIANLSKEAMAKHAEDYIALAALMNIIYDIDIDELDGLLGQCGPFVGENETVQRIRTCKMAEKTTAEGQPFVDFSGKTPEGTDIKLSDIVGKGKWVLADFWASWCGPCKREIPNIKKTHETLSGDKFTVLGVAVWDGDNSSSVTTMQEMEMTWPQIFVGDDKTPTDSYGIVGIPTMILFAPDGTIAKRGEALRGENMAETVKALMQQ